MEKQKRKRESFSVDERLMFFSIEQLAQYKEEESGDYNGISMGIGPYRRINQP